MAYTKEITITSNVRRKFDNIDYSHLDLTVAECVVLKEGDREDKVRADYLARINTSLVKEVEAALPEFDYKSK